MNRWVALVLAALLAGCQQVENSLSGDDARFGGGAASVGGSTAFLAVRAVMSAKCGRCHSDFLSATESGRAADPYFIARGDPNCSRLYYRLSGSGASCAALAGLAHDMPQGDHLTSGELTTFSVWIQSLGSGGGTGGDPVDDTGGSAAFTAARAVLQSRCSGASCHGSAQTPVSGAFVGPVPAFAAFTLEAQFVTGGLVVARSPATSWLFRALQTYGNIGTMPKSSSPLSSADKTALETWINGLE